MIIIKLLKSIRTIEIQAIRRFSFKPNEFQLHRKRCRMLLERNFTTQEKANTNKKEWRGVVTRFLPIGICLVAVMQWRSYRKYSKERIATQLEIDAYTILPLKSISRWWGFVANLNQPEFIRPYIYGLYANLFGVNLHEAEYGHDLRSYPTLCDFFVRELKSGSRPIDAKSELVAPCDGTVLHLSPVVNGKVEQVKGITYPIDQFLGEKIHLQKRNTGLYQCVIYLAPGDYHRFHSPTEWNINYRRHFPGELLSVNPSIARFIPGLFVLNERAVYVGEWRHGFFSYSAVGATNVGSVRVYFDSTLQTNNPRCKQADQCSLADVTLNKGEMIGEFRMGSTIVLIFEAPHDFAFTIQPGQKVRMGEAIGGAKQREPATTTTTTTTQ